MHSTASETKKKTKTASRKEEIFVSEHTVRKQILIK